MHKRVIFGRGGGDIILTDHIPNIHNKVVFLMNFLYRFGLLYQFRCICASNSLENAIF